ncbi:MAG: DUF1850 domain-containing protein [Treponema sp.]|nr:DUF1850 domain-containing protein [Treponema sp.]
MKKKHILIALVLLLLVNFPVVRVLSITNRKNFSERVYSCDGAVGFVISYTHSVNKGRVHDFYRVLKDDSLELFMTEFVSYGAGIPEAYETPGAEFFVTDGGYVIKNLNRKLPSLVMAVGLLADHSVCFGKKSFVDDDFAFKDDFFLKDFFLPQTSLLFEVKRVSILDYIIVMSKKSF